MRSAIDFLPECMTVFTNLVTRRRVSTAWSVNFGSGSGLRLGTSPLRGICFGPLLWPLGAVLRTPLPAVGHARGVEGAADDVIADAREILDAASADQHHRVLLQVVPFAWDIGRDLHAVGETDAGHLAQGRIRFLRRGRIDADTDAAA